VAALGYSFFPLLVWLGKLGLIKSKDKDIKETIQLLKSKSILFSNPESAENEPLKLAERIKGNFRSFILQRSILIPLTFAGGGQIAENAKQLSSGHMLPEMNHNELVGWKL